MTDLKTRRLGRSTFHAKEAFQGTEENGKEEKEAILETVVSGKEKTMKDRVTTEKDQDQMKETTDRIKEVDMKTDRIMPLQETPENLKKEEETGIGEETLTAVPQVRILKLKLIFYS